MKFSFNGSVPAARECSVVVFILWSCLPSRLSMFGSVLAARDCSVVVLHHDHVCRLSVWLCPHSSWLPCCDATSWSCLPSQCLVMSPQLVIAVLWCYIMIMSAVYVCNLTAMLTITKHPVEFETAKELYEANIPVGSLGDFFKGELATAVDHYIKVLCCLCVSFALINQARLSLSYI